MFIDQEQEKSKEIPGQPPAIAGDSRNFNIFLFIGGALITIALGLVFYYFYPFSRHDPARGINQKDKAPVSTSSTGDISGLPGDISNGDDDTLWGTTTENLRAEDLTFGHFYKKANSDFQPPRKILDLPVNIKTDTINYYDLARKISLDDYVESINNRGFAVLAESRGAGQNDFFNAYRNLLDKRIPIAVTSDFILYYYQNIFKQVYKELEKNIFYENVRDIAESFYAIALAGYKKRLAEVGAVNDPVLEAKRMETAYFAVALKLLSPSREQISDTAGANSPDKFTADEAAKYDFTVPEFFTDDVESEVSLIKEMKRITKSPVMLYDRNYTFFAVPANYKNNAKLNNFYLASRWLNSVFPLYFKNAECPECLLDYDDWSISIGAAGFIAEDFSRNQDLKNRWAIIYKFIAFFSGLRQDLTYLNYQDSLSDLFGEDYDMEKIMSAQNANRNKDLDSLQEKLAGYRFSELEGMLNRGDRQVKPLIGLRVLQENYWPNDHIFGRLTGEDLPIIDQTADISKVFTACRGSNNSVKYRCRGFGLDIINLLRPVDSLNTVFSINTAYENYSARVDELKREINKFDQNSWNNNIYWLDLDLSRLLLNGNKEYLPVFMGSKEWREAKEYNTILGAWANLHFPADVYANYFEQNNNTLGYSSECSSYNYVEPNIELIRDLMSRNEMLVKMLTTLRVAEKTNAVSIELKELNQKLEKLSAISKKELENIELDNDDCLFIKDLTTNFEVKPGNSAIYNLVFKDKKLQISLTGVKLMALINQLGDKKVLVLGPVFNYQEK